MKHSTIFFFLPGFLLLPYIDDTLLDSLPVKGLKGVWTMWTTSCHLASRGVNFPKVLLSQLSLCSCGVSSTPLALTLAYAVVSPVARLVFSSEPQTLASNSPPGISV